MSEYKTCGEISCIECDARYAEALGTITALRSRVEELESYGDHGATNYQRAMADYRAAILQLGIDYFRDETGRLLDSDKIAPRLNQFVADAQRAAYERCAKIAINSFVSESHIVNYKTAWNTACSWIARLIESEMEKGGAGMSVECTCGADKGICVDCMEAEIDRLKSALKKYEAGVEMEGEIDYWEEEKRISIKLPRETESEWVGQTVTVNVRVKE